MKKILLITALFICVLPNYGQSMGYSRRNTASFSKAQMEQLDKQYVKYVGKHGSVTSTEDLLKLSYLLGILPNKINTLSAFSAETAPKFVLDKKIIQKDYEKLCQNRNIELDKNEMKTVVNNVANWINGLVSTKKLATYHDKNRNDVYKLLPWDESVEIMQIYTKYNVPLTQMFETITQGEERATGQRAQLEEINTKLLKKVVEERNALIEPAIAQEQQKINQAKELEKIKLFEFLQNIPVSSHPEWRPLQDDLSSINLVSLIKIRNTGNLQYSDDLLNKALSGDPKSLLNLGYCYYYGLGIEEKQNEAIRLFRDAALYGEFEGYAQALIDGHMSSIDPKVSEAAIKYNYAPLIYASSIYVSNFHKRNMAFFLDTESVRDEQKLLKAVELGYPEAVCLYALIKYNKRELSTEQYKQVLQRFVPSNAMLEVYIAREILNKTGQMELPYDIAKKYIKHTYFRNLFTGQMADVFFQNGIMKRVNNGSNLLDAFLQYHTLTYANEDEMADAIMNAYTRGGNDNNGNLWNIKHMPCRSVPVLLDCAAIKNLPNQDLYDAIRYLLNTKESEKSFIEEKKAKDLIVSYGKSGNVLGMFFAYQLRLDTSVNWLSKISRSGSEMAIFTCHAGSPSDYKDDPNDTPVSIREVEATELEFTDEYKRYYKLNKDELKRQEEIMKREKEARDRYMSKFKSLGK